MGVALLILNPKRVSTYEMFLRVISLLTELYV